MRIGLACIEDISTTGRYFERISLPAGSTLSLLGQIDDPSALYGLDLLLIIDPMLQSPEILKRSPCLVAGYLIDTHQNLDVRLAYSRYFDYVFLAQRDDMPSFEALPHPSVHWLPLACDPTVHFKADLERIFDVGFVGKLGYPNTDRRKVLEHVLSRFSTNNYTEYYSPDEMGWIYSRSKIVFNKSINGDLNMRFFEALASGALLITDRIGNGLSDIATEGVHFIAYTTAEEAERQVSYYLKYPEQREAIAAAGQRLAFEKHTYSDRLREALSVLHPNATAQAPARFASRKTELVWRSECHRIQGLGLSKAFSLSGEDGWSAKSLANITVSLLRGLSRSLRQKPKR